MVGKILAQYQITEKLGQGGMGIVWAARHVLTGKACALKFLKGRRAHDPRSHERLLREARAACAVRHPNVAQVHVIQCDIEVTHDDWLEPPELLEYRVAGFGGSDMTPGIRYFAIDPEVQSILVLTDGYITIPTDEPPYRVLWGLIGEYSEGFEPPYGDVVKMKLE